MTATQLDTIAAISTAPGQAGIAIIRLSGPDAIPIAERVFDGKERPSRLAGGQFRHGYLRSASGDHIDEVVLLVYRAPHSYTREDVIEIQGHGGRETAGRILGAVAEAGARVAEPGEFTKRAFLNGRIDLVQAEAVADLIRARSERAAAAAMAQLEGSLSSSLNALYDDLMTVAADLEATLDFAEDELPETTFERVMRAVESARDRAHTLLETWEEGRLLREGALVVLSGRPNVGKSTLMNRLLGYERAIVTDVAGTTRDALEEQLVLRGVPIRLVDTAGLHDADCRIEQEGIRRARAHIQDADINVHLIDGALPLREEDHQLLAELPPSRTLLLINKTDQGCEIADRDVPTRLRYLRTCLLDHSSISEIQDNISELISVQEDTAHHAVISTRHRTNIHSALDELTVCLALLRNHADADIVLAAENIRAALEQLGIVTGRIYSEELLDTIFSRFCIGK